MRRCILSVICASLSQLVLGTWVATAIGGEWHCPEAGDLSADDKMLGRRRTNVEYIPGSISPGQLHHVGEQVVEQVVDRDAMQLGHGRVNVYKTHGVSIGRDGLPQIQLHIHSHFPRFPVSGFIRTKSIVESPAVTAPRVLTSGCHSSDVRHYTVFYIEAQQSQIDVSGCSHSSPLCTARWTVR